METERVVVKVSTRCVGQRKPLLGDFDVTPPSDIHDDGDMPLRHLIEHVVRQQVRAFNERQEGSRFDRVLSAASIHRGAAQGKVNPAGRPGRELADADEAVATALQAFEDGMYLVVIDEVERRGLDEPVYLSPNSRMVFLRLTFLAGA